MYRVRLNPGAQRQLDRLSGSQLERVAGALRGLAENPRPLGTKKIRRSIHRIRLGNWRVIYSIQDKESLVVVGRIARRSKDTYSDLDDLF